MTRSRLLLAAAATAVALGTVTALTGTVVALRDDPWIAAIVLGGLTLLVGGVILIAVDLAGTRRLQRNLESIREQLRRIRTEQVSLDDLTAPAAPLQRALDEGRVELQAISEAAIENEVLARQAVEALVRDVRQELVLGETGSVYTELRNLTSQALPGLRDELRSHIEGTEDRLVPRIRSTVHDELRASTDYGGTLQRLVRGESSTLFTLLESLDKIHRQLDLAGVLPPFGGWAIRPDLGHLLVELVLAGDRDGIVDLGSGISTVLLAAAAREVGHGHVVSVDHLSEYAEATRRHLARLGLSDWATVVVAPLVPTQVGDENYTWYDASAVDWPDQIDLLLVDGPPADTGPQARYPAIPVLGDRLADGAVVLLDDAQRADEQAVGARWSEELEGSSATQLDHAVGTFRLDLDGRGGP